MIQYEVYENKKTFYFTEDVDSNIFIYFLHPPKTTENYQFKSQVKSYEYMTKKIYWPE